MKRILIFVLVVTFVMLAACGVKEGAATPTGTETSALSTDPSEPQRDTWIFRDSDQRYLTSADLKDLTAEELKLADGEILARKGFIFTDPDMAAHFEKQSWYEGTVTEDQFTAAMLSECERSNARLIELYQMRLDGPSFYPGNPYEAYYDPARPYIIPTSATVPLIEGDYLGMTAETVYIAWNEILARHGFVSEDQVLTEYFMHQDWYLPDTPVGDAESIALSKLEQENLRILKAYQKTVEDQGLDMAFTNTVSCQYFSVTTPAYWAEFGLAEINTDSIRFREKAAYEAGMGGHVFTLRLYAAAEEYDQMPAWKLLGKLTDPNGKIWHLVAIYPTDVQFPLESGDMYMRMDRAVDSVIATVTAGEGCAFTPAE